MVNSTRRNISYPQADRSDPPDIPLYFKNLVDFLDLDVVYNQGTDAARIAAAHMTSGGRIWWATDTLQYWYDDGANWRLVGANISRGTFAGMPAAAASNINTLYFATDVNGGTFYYSDGAVWTQVTRGLKDYTEYGTVFPTTGLFNGYRFTLFVTNTSGGNCAWSFIYRADLDATYPWHFCGGPPVHVSGSSYTTVRAGAYLAQAKGWIGNGGTTTGGDININLYFNGVAIDAQSDNGASSAASGTGARGNTSFSLMAEATIVTVGQTISADAMVNPRLIVTPQKLI